MDNKSLTYTDEQMLVNAGVRVTAVRLLVWRTIRHELTDAFSITDLEALLPTVDRSTMFRTIHTLTEAELLHEIDDGSGMQKYCVCHCDDLQHRRGHVHLTCTKCHRTFCLIDVEIPPVALPAGFDVQHTEYVVKGLCKDCKV